MRPTASRVVKRTHTHATHTKSQTNWLLLVKIWNECDHIKRRSFLENIVLLCKLATGNNELPTTNRTFLHTKASALTQQPQPISTQAAAPARPPRFPSTPRQRTTYGLPNFPAVFAPSTDKLPPSIAHIITPLPQQIRYSSSLLYHNVSIDDHSTHH